LRASHVSDAAFCFRCACSKTLSESERKRIATTMDMRPISEEYELELRRPMQSIVSGKIARLVLIQLQFVKKELLVAMQAIDDLFNANQVNLQLLAITPAVLSIVSLNIVSKTLIAAFRATSRGKKVESSAAINRELREGIRTIERVFFLFHDSQSGMFTTSAREEMSLEDSGRVLSSLHKMQGILVMNNNFFDSTVLRQLQVRMKVHF
jgi:nuclear-control-of-ATPase protein 2